ncbi:MULTISPECIES: hypothetical protein [Rhizobium/Agrobacterium group]|uniref:Uncharacterized protein n=3 Tax=Rhizobium/Agrobacterium group TaxID=227290 RepID=B9JZM2_ALLAM|nr:MULTISPECIES: hypothetical protein [Rhizobium/Agrobacterium group]ACM37332.1 hypothetical protein Avi_3256 [Allorhizobium ampelinum S4]MCF1448809.1 hypothetical protein [Allorhizobium ampelinum]MCF1482892.1 hypothetical protein [Allorhizobium ampelinum]MCF1492328.1 hypothetical protein [Allorhizobium ampelinum]MUO30153.1 hypothetical protein [Agrobacterium vitis]
MKKVFFLILIIIFSIGIILVILSKLGSSLNYSSERGDILLEKNTVLELTKLSDIKEIIHIEEQEKWDGKDQTLRLRGFFETNRKEDLIKILYQKGFSENNDLYFFTGDDDLWWHKPNNTKNPIYLTREAVSQTENIKIYDTQENRSIFLMESVSF